MVSTARSIADSNARAYAFMSNSGECRAVSRRRRVICASLSRSRASEPAIDADDYASRATNSGNPAA
jgi:hypothetical protein